MLKMAAAARRVNPLKWFSGISNRWKLTLGVIVGAPVLWEMTEHRKVRQKRIFYNKAIKDLVFMDFAVGNRYIGRVLIGLYTDQVPLSVENFIQLCEGYSIREKLIGYKNTHIHAVFPRIGLMGGDVLTGNGTHQLSIYGPTFPDENFNMEFIQDGDVALCNSGPHSNSSHFMITFSPLRILHGQNVVIGTILKGMRVIRKIESLGTRQGKPEETIRIIHCGLYKGEDGPPFYAVLDEDNAIEKQMLSEDDFFKLNKDEQEARIQASRPLHSYKASPHFCADSSTSSSVSSTSSSSSSSPTPSTASSNSSSMPSDSSSRK